VLPKTTTFHLPDDRIRIHDAKRAGRRPHTASCFSAVCRHAYFFQGSGWNQNAHYGHDPRVVETTIRDLRAFCRQQMAEVSRVNGRIYSNKPPGLAIMRRTVCAGREDSHSDLLRQVIIHADIRGDSGGGGCARESLHSDATAPTSEFGTRAVASRSARRGPILGMLYNHIPVAPCVRGLVVISANNPRRRNATA